MKIFKYIEDYLKGYKNFKDYWNYEDGCILNGCIRMYEASGDEFYSNFIFRYLSDVISDDGKILTYDNSKHSADSFNSGKSLFFAYDRSGEEKYLKAADFLFNKITEYPRTPEGNFIHKSIYPGQVWLDGLYMIQPFYASCLYRRNCSSYDDILNQFKNVRKYMFCPEKNLYCHGYDSARVQLWADKNNGKSPSFWLRAIGWYLMSLVDTYEAAGDRNKEFSSYLAGLFREALEGLSEYSDSRTGLFFQVVDRPDEEKNYTETSGSLMIAYAAMKSARLGFPDSAGNADSGRKIFESTVSEKLLKSGDRYVLSDICSSAGLGPDSRRDGTAEYYYSESRVSDDPKGAGAFMMALSEVLIMNGGPGVKSYE